MVGARSPRIDGSRGQTLAVIAGLLVAATWGPGRAGAGVNVWTSQGPEGGSVSHLVVMPGPPTRVLAATLSGKTIPTGDLWSSPDAASSWHRSAAFGEFDRVDDLVVHPTETGVVYAALTRAGLMMSRDWGEHWASVSTWAVRALAIAPSRPSRMYACGQYGQVLRSDDGGATWSSVSQGLPPGTTVDALAVGPDSDATVYAGARGGFVFRSSDGGDTWATGSAGLPDDASAQVWLLTADFHAPARLLALVNDDHGGSGVYRSENDGETWSPLLLQPGYTRPSALALTPHDPARIYAAAGGEVFLSTDDGASWRPVANPVAEGIGIAQLVVDPDDPDVLYAATSDGPGVLRSLDAGRTWAPSAHGLSATAIRTLAYGPAPNGALHATDGSTHLFTSNGQGERWNDVGPVSLCFFANTLLVNPANQETLYLGCSAGVFKSLDAGLSWGWMKNGLDAVEQEVDSLAVDPTNTLTLYAGSRRFFDMGRLWGNVMYKTTNGGENWSTAISGLPTDPGAINAIAVDPRRSATVYAGGKGLWRSVDGGGHWALYSSLADYPSLAAIVVDPRDSDTVLCAALSPQLIGGKVYTVTRGGANVLASVPPGGSGALAVDPVNASTLYAGGYGGVSMSVDGGTTWNLVNAGLARVHVTALAIDRTGTRLHAATDGGGVFDLEISTLAPGISISPAAASMTIHGSVALTATVDPPQLIDAELAVDCSDPGVASVPASVALPAGSGPATVPVAGAGTAGTATVTVRLPNSLGGASATATVTATARPASPVRRRVQHTAP
ncbi:MAG TPA: hypothetical protein VMT19_13280 [Thermoanaerobaculaceae bacterium]|nr:hypothetical protein [Thermoanaerobaculaceae bacterium]